MTLIRCPDCQKEVSSAAPACLNCGRPLGAALVAVAARGPACPRCGSHQVGKARGLQGLGEVAVFVLLFILGVVPGILYYLYMESVPCCQACGHRDGG